MKRQDAKLVFECSSVLLSYPEDDFEADLCALAKLIEKLPRGKARAFLDSSVKELASKPQIAAATRYVETFDLQKRRSLHLTYYRHGDTRERGAALASLMEVYKLAGATLVQGELPDYLPALLELAAVSTVGSSILREYRSSIQLLHGELAKSPNPYTGVVEAAMEAIGGASKSDQIVIQRYLAEGPPVESVGLEPFSYPKATDKKAELR